MGGGAVATGGRTGAGTTAGAGAGAGTPGEEGSGCGGSCSAGTVVTGMISGTDCVWFPVASPATRARKADTDRPATPIFAFRAGETRETRGARGLVIVAGGFVFGCVLRVPALVTVGLVATGGLSRPGRGRTGAAAIAGRRRGRAGGCGTDRRRGVVRQENLIGGAGETRRRVTQSPGIHRQGR